MVGFQIEKYPTRKPDLNLWDPLWVDPSSCHKLFIKICLNFTSIDAIIIIRFITRVKKKKMVLHHSFDIFETRVSQNMYVVMAPPWIDQLKIKQNSRYGNSKALLCINHVKKQWLCLCYPWSSRAFMSTTLWTSSRVPLVKNKVKNWKI